MLWIRPQRIQDAILAHSAPQETEVGREADMRSLGRGFLDRGLQIAKSGPQSWQLSPWACELQREVAALGATLVLIELPMPSAYRGVRSSAFGQFLRGTIRTDLCARPSVWISLSEVPELTDERFSDGLHLDRRGAMFTSRLLGYAAGTALLDGVR
jgi:hypothetical protein